MLATTFFAVAFSITNPALLSLTSRRATVEQGIAMGLSNSFVSLGRIVGPVWGGFIFDVNVTYPYLSGAAIMFAGFLISLICIAQRKSERPATGRYRLG
jgi:DHA1 family multidrug resistance protein-like MFS transporter